MESITLAELIAEYHASKSLHRMEGEAGVRGLEMTLSAIGYKSDQFRYGSSIEKFLIDNPGAIEALYDWIIEQDTEEWKEEIETHLPAL